MDFEIGGRIGHVRLEKQLGRGGMGEVWEGFDEALHRRVAVKAIHQQQRGLPGGRERFLREARILSQLDHPNICRVYELVEGKVADCLILELVAGENLEAAARRGLSYAQKLAVAEQIARALAAAHQRRIVHRDLKPENVMVTGDGTVKVLDFGIARLIAPEDGAESAEPPHTGLGPPGGDEGELEGTLDLRPPRQGVPRPLSSSSSWLDSAIETLPGSLLGTLRYMSPEQAAGDRVYEASDLYSLGILLQELFTGEATYAPCGSLPELREQVVAGATVPIRREGLDGALVDLLEELLERDPEIRPSAADVAARLAELRAMPERRRRRRRAAGLALAGGLLLASAIAVTVHLSRPSPLVAPDTEVRIAVLPLQDTTGEEGYEWVEQGLQQMVATALRGGEGLTVAEPRMVAETLGRLEVSPDLVLPADRLFHLTEALGADLLIATSVGREEGRFRLDFAIYDSRGPLAHDFVLAADPVTGARGLAEALARRLAPAGALVDFQQTFSRDAFANQAFAIGVQRSRTTGAAAAEPYFRVSLDRDPSFGRAQLLLADALFRLGDPAGAAEMVREVAGAAAAGGDPRLQVEAVRQLAEITQEQGDYTEAEARLREVLGLLEQTPDAEVEARARNQLGILWYRQGDMAAAREELEAAAGLARQRGLMGLLAPILTPLAFVHLRSGDHDAAEELFLEVLQRARRSGHREWQAGALSNLGNLRLEQGDLEMAGAYFEEAHQVFDELGSVRGRLITTINLGAVRLHLGEVAEAERLTREALVLARELNDRRSETFSLAALGYFASRRGKLPEADGYLSSAAEHAASLGDREVTWLLARNVAYLRILQGRLGDARTALDEALAVKRDGLTMLVEARLAYASGDLAAAAELYQAAKAQGDLPWAGWRNEVLATYRRAAAEGRVVPLPDEASASPLPFVR